MLPLPRTEFADHRPARVLEVFGDVNFCQVPQIKPSQHSWLLDALLMLTYLLTYLLTYSLTYS